MRRRLAALIVPAALLAGCGPGAAPRAPEILYGEDICDRCRMVISEERHAAAARLDDRDYRFDDPGCLLAFLDSAVGAAGAEAWVHDESETWWPAEEAWFVRDPEHATPMASGILAFGTRRAAEIAARRHGAVPRRWDELAAGADR